MSPAGGIHAHIKIRGQTRGPSPNDRKKYIKYRHSATPVARIRKLPPRAGFEPVTLNPTDTAISHYAAAIRDMRLQWVVYMEDAVPTSAENELWR